MLRQKFKHHFPIKKIIALTGLVVLIWLSLMSPLSAQDVTQGYSSDEVLQRGMLVVLKADDTSKVEAADLSNAERIQGVVVNSNDSPLTISESDNKVFVATKGRYEALVSNENGTIEEGDYVTTSNLKGIGMKAGETQPTVVGKALVGFDGTKSVLGKSDLKNSNGTAKSVAIGRIYIDIGVGGNPLAKPEKLNLPGILKAASEAIAGKQVSPFRVYISLFVLIIVISVTGAMLFAGIRSGVISIGRNPLSKKSILRTLTQVIITSIIILIIGVFGVYLILVV